LGFGPAKQPPNRNGSNQENVSIATARQKVLGTPKFADCFIHIQGNLLSSFNSLPTAQSHQPLKPSAVDAQ
jgi:hypothetical protein